ncbi:MAG: ribonuclease J [Erysipelotrichaceae bacterium]|nr:ribonuclease J [Erysipelotrichaceae bacterium]MDD4642148.1 ribonuclease J [Erysipelotrichaceae bacterium]
MDKIRLFALGGLDEDGKNLYVVEINNDIILIESGLKYPENEQLGVEMIIPDYNYLQKNSDRIRAIFITHAHDDVLGSLAYLTKQINIPIYTTPLTAEVVRLEMKKIGVTKYSINLIKRSDVLKIGNTQVKTFGITTSIMDGFGLAIATSHGYIVYCGEFIIDSDVKLETFASDVSELSEIGKQGVFALMCESSGVDNKGYTAPNHRITDLVENHIENARSRIIITAYEQNLYRIIEILELANKYHKRLFIYDDGLRELLKIVEKLGYYKIPPKISLTKEKFSNDLDDVIILVTGNGPNVFKIMMKIAMGEDGKVTLDKNDTVIIGSPSGDTLEVESSNTVNELYKEDVKVVVLDSKKVYSIHASSEDLKMMIYLFKPKYYIPIKGEYRHLVDNANIALDMGYRADHIIVLDNGQIATFENGFLKTTSDLIDLTDVMIDGNDNSDISSFVLKDRDVLSKDGAIIVGIVINYNTKEVIGGPDVQSRGLIYLKDADYIVKEVGNILEDTIKEAVADNRFENMAVRMEAKERITRYLLKETGKRPMILPTIVEINISE